MDTPGDTTCKLGKQPIGFFMYDRAGNLCMQAMRTPPSGTFVKDSVPLAGMAQ
jgi:hypothetical protein